MHKLKHMLACSLAALTTVVVGADLSSYDVEGEPLPNITTVTNGHIPFKKQVIQPDNLTNILHGIAKALEAEKIARTNSTSSAGGSTLSKFLIGRNLTVDEYIVKVTVTPNEGGTFPFGDYFYSTSSNLVDDIKYYDANFEVIGNDSPSRVHFSTDNNGELVVESIGPAGTNVTWQIASLEPYKATVLSVQDNEDTTYGYAMPRDWNIVWRSLDGEVVASSTTSNSVIDSAGRWLTTYKFETIHGNMVELGINYFDEVNVPHFVINKYEVLDGPGTISDFNILTSSGQGVVNVRVSASNGDIREAPVSMYQSKAASSYSNYSNDSNTNRKRVNDFHLDLLQRFRSNATTNYHYGTWNSPSYTPHDAYSEDRFTGNYGKRFHPFQHVTCNSGGNASFWWSHAVLTRHVLLAAKHYGLGNHNRILNGYSYINYDNKFSGKVQLKLVRYVALDEWAAANGFEGDDANTGDLAMFVVEGDIPDECLPYLATADYLNATYGVDNVSTNEANALDKSYSTAFIPSISLNQANMVAIRANYVCDMWGSQTHPPLEKNQIYMDGIIRDNKFRADLYQYIRLGAWHGVVMGDSGHPTYLYDPALTTGLTDSVTGEPLYRPILLCAYHTTGGGPHVGRYLKVIKAFVESVGDQLEYVLGDPDTQSSASSVIKANAIRAMGGTVKEE